MSRHRVAIVVDRCFGDKLRPLSRRMHVWCCDTPANREVAMEVWNTLNGEDCLNEGVTTFVLDESASPEEVLVRILKTVDEHHANWSTIEVYGCSVMPEVQNAFHEFEATVRQVDGRLIARRAE